MARESEDKVEFKRGEQGNVAYDGGTKAKPADRRRCILGYVVALCNERGGSLVIGMDDRYPHKVVGTRQSENATGTRAGTRYQLTDSYKNENAIIDEAIKIGLDVMRNRIRPKNVQEEALKKDQEENES